MQPELKEHKLSTHAWKQFKHNKPAYISLYILGILTAIAILAPVLANDRPLYCIYKGNTLFPAFSFKNNYELKSDDGTIEKIQLDNTDWKNINFDKVVWAPVPYAPGKSDNVNANYKSPTGEQFFRNTQGELLPMPGKFRHRLGTTSRGEDILSGLIHGTRISLTIGFISMGIASIIGLLLGSIAGYFGDSTLTTSRGKFWTGVCGVFIAWFYAFQARHFALSNAIAVSGMQTILQLLISIVIFIFIIALFLAIGKQIGKIPWLNKKVYVPADALISRIIEIINSLPTFILIITIAAIAKPSIINLMVIIGLTNWTGIARLTRAEFLRIRNLEYIQAAKSLGFTQTKIILKHALPNALAPATVAIAFGIANAILIESGLSFLGIGVPPDMVTWGALVNEGRANFDAWWLVIYPGIAIFLTVTVYNLIGEGLRDAFDPKLKK